MSRKIKIFAITGCLIFTLGVCGVMVYSFAYTKDTKASSLGKGLKKAVFEKDVQNQVIARVNGINISQADVNFMIWEHDNSPDNNSSSDSMNQEEAIKEVAKEKLLLSEARKNNISLSDDQIQKMRSLLISSISNNLKENQDFINALEMSKDQVVDFVLQKEVAEKKMASYLSSKVLPMVLGDSYYTTDSNLNKAITELRRTADGNERMQRLSTMYDAYKNMLLNSADLELS